MTAKSKVGVWDIAQAAKYHDSGRGQPAIKSWHAFSWDKAASAFVLKQDLGMTTTREGLVVPVPLATAFLRRCCQPGFRIRFFDDAFPLEAAEEVISYAGKERLEVSRGTPTPLAGRLIMPGLSIKLAGEDDNHLYLFHGLREALGRVMEKVDVQTLGAKLR